MNAAITLFLLAVLSAAQAQVNDDAIRQRVLEKSIIDSTFVFGRWTADGGTETHLKYLGEVKTNSDKILKVMNSVWLWGLSQHATNRLLIFNEKNQYVGEYYISTTDDMPTRLRNGMLIFENIDLDCDEKLVTEIDLKKGLPAQFFRKCKGPFGDLYSFN
jgi:hypothetical protein